MLKDYSKILIMILALLVVPTITYALTATYDYTSPNNKAYNDTSTNTSVELLKYIPSYASWTEYSADMYANISANDSLTNTYSTSNGIAGFHYALYAFNINQSINNINNITFIYVANATNGNNESTSVYNLNMTTNNWTVLNLSDNIIGNFIGGSGIEVYNSDDMSQIINGSIISFLAVKDRDSSMPGCAFVYSFNGNNYTAEVALADLSSEDAGMFYTQYGSFNYLKPVNNTLRLAVWEKVKETSYIDDLSLIEINSSPGLIVLPEQYTGILHTINTSKIIHPVNVTDGYTDYTEQLSLPDSVNYWVTNLSTINLDNPPMWNELYFSFKPEWNNTGEQQKIKLVMRAKDTGLVSWVVTKLFTAIYGPDVKDYAPDEEMAGPILQWGRDAAVRVYYLDNGSWTEVGHNFFGVVAFYHTYVMTFNVSKDEELRFKIIAMPYAQQIDEVYIDPSEDSAITTKQLKPTIIRNNMNIPNDNLTELLSSQDYNFVKTVPDDFFEASYNTTCEDCHYVINSTGFAALWTLPYAMPEGMLDGWFNNRTERQVFKEIMNEPLMTSLPVENIIPHHTHYEDYVALIVNYNEAQITPIPRVGIYGSFIRIINKLLRI